MWTAFWRSSSGGSVTNDVVVFVVVNEAVTTFLFPDFRGLEVSLGLLVLLKMRFLPEVNSARKTVEGTNPLVNALMHVAIARRREYLKQ